MKYLITVLAFIGICWVEVEAQDIEKQQFEMNGEFYSVSFTPQLKSLLPSHKSQKEGGRYVFDFSDSDKQDYILYLDINGIQWDPRITSDISNELSLVIKNIWLDGGSSLKAITPIREGNSSRSIKNMEIEVTSNASSRLVVNFGIKEPGVSTAGEVNRSSGQFSLPYLIRGGDFDGVTMLIEPDPEEELETAIDADPDPVEQLDEDQLAWEACGDLGYTSACLDNYLKDHPGGRFVTNARNILAERAKVPPPLKKTPPPSNSNTPKITKTEEDLAWEDIENVPAVEKCGAYEAFLDTYSNSDKYKYAAERGKKEYCKIVILTEKISDSDSRFRITLRNVIQPQIKKVTGEAGLIIDKSGFSGDPAILEIELLDANPHSLFLVDPFKWAEVQSVEIELDNLLVLQLDSTDVAYSLGLEGGVSPFSVYLRNKGRLIPIQENANTRQFTINRNDLNRGTFGYGTFQFVVRDGRANLDYQNDTLIYVENPGIPWYIPAVIGALALLLIIRSIRKRKTLRQYQELQQMRKQERMEEGLVGHKIVRKPEPEMGRQTEVAPKLKAIPSENKPPENHPAPVMESGKKAGLMKIKSRREVDYIDQLGGGGEEMAMFGGDFFHLSLDEIWLDTAVVDIFLGRKAIGDLNSFLKNQKTTMDESGDLLPEIGGFLMGKALRGEERNYRVSVEEFVPVSPEFHNVYQLEFSTQSLVQELGDAQDRFPDLKLVGWFHTHPGHGLFLSKPDLTIQDGFFRKPYQFAMEIDNLSPRQDMTFFTRRQDGSTNNKHTRKAGVLWFAWADIRSFD